MNEERGDVGRNEPVSAATSRGRHIPPWEVVWCRHTAVDLVAIPVAWALLLACMAIAQAMHYRLGFAVWPLGEDRVWIEIIQGRNPLAAAKAFWQINDRNPLAPWWYIGLRPIILNYDAGLLVIREVVGLLLAGAAYIFLLVMTQARTFALGVALVITVFLANGYIDQIYWTMLIALVFSLCSLSLYKIFLLQGSLDYRLYTAALVAWFIALGTYSIQTGAILAIVFISFISPAPTALARFRRSVTDTLPFALFFIVFWLEWQTTSRIPYLERPHLHAAISSIFQLFWHFDYLAFFNGVVYVDLSYRLVFLAASLVVGGFVYFATGLHRHEHAFPPSPRRLVETAIAIGCLMLPVLAVEASGYGIIGEAWRKVYQLTTPLLYLTITAAVLVFLPAQAALNAWRIVVTLCAAAATAVTLGINRVQVEVTRNEQLLKSALSRFAQENLASGYAPPFLFLVRRTPGFIWYSSDLLSPVYGRTWGLPPGTSFRFLPDEYTTDPRQSLRYTEFSVENASLDGAIVSNDHIFVLSATPKGIQRLCQVGPEDVTSSLVEWQRRTALKWSIGECAAPVGDR